ncbi:hypothetical protein V2A60_002005 [Cordyceps javanica]|uniref:Transcriptional repressor involved in the control of multidrug resistance n=1 Tax=Cordyceps javanica TaxID=43265 RepID=A0A545WDT5_9HYPO|nr:transcriptional repressor involved in the control of multidrug resistance [Cordyceps javanica]TQW12143.1 transcriptional repressor involved in the control of multidrug resistance [Cordyceps javanica]
MPKRTQRNRPQPNAERRRRVYAACSECRRRRRKCDGSQPCAQCQAYGYACSYHDAESTSDTANDPARRQPETVPHRSSRAAVSATADEDAQQPPPPPPSTLIVSRERGRLINANSAVALPHLVGQELAMEQPLRLHSYAWNLGIRPERRGAVAAASSLSDYLTLAECQALCGVYFAAVHPLFAFLDGECFARRLAQGWPALEGGGRPNFAAVVALVAALGSFFAAPPGSAHPREQDVQRHGLSILDLALSSPVAAIDMDAVAGWILRALYMRLTTRPAISCLASHTAMHLCEIMGLHRDLAGSSAPAPAAPATPATPAALSKAAFSDEELEARRRYFCAARFLNLLLATEYGLSGVAPRHARCTAPVSVPGAHIEALHALAGVLGDADAAAGAGLGSDDFADLFARLRDVPRGDDAVVALFAADACLCLLRRFAAASSRPGKHVTEVSAAVLRRALDGVADLLAEGRTWWNMLSVPFQSVCIGVSADDMSLLSLLPAAMELLRTMADRFGSHMAREALATAQQVIAASRGCTDAKLAVKDAALTHALPAVDIDWASFDSGFDLGGEWPPVVDFFM